MQTRHFASSVAVFVAISMLSAACSDADEPVREVFTGTVEADDTVTTLIPPVPTDPPGRLTPRLGELDIPCGRTDAPTALASVSLGVGASSIVIGTGNDRGGPHVQGSGKGMPDAVEAMAGYCNSLGGLAGRDVVVIEYDAAVVELQDRTIEQCGEVVAVVGQGYLREDLAAEVRDRCALGTFPGWDPGLLGGEPFPLQGHLYATALNPAAADVALLGPATEVGAAAMATRGQALAEAVEEIRVVGEFVYSIEAQPDWSAVAADIMSSGAGLVYIDGSCASAVVPYLEAAAVVGNDAMVLAGPSAYDSECLALAALAGVDLDRLLIELPFLPLEDGDAAPVSIAHADLLRQVAAPVTGDALLASSAFWRWAVAVDRCGARLSRPCLREEAQTFSRWTAGDLHRPFGADGLSEPCLVVMGVVDGALERRSPRIAGTYDCDVEKSVALRETDE